jgi:hypothetical protein
MTRKSTYVRPELGKEEFVRHIFSQYAKDLGFEILNIQKAFPDCTAIDLRNHGSKKVLIELEYEAQNFVQHGHVDQMVEGETHIVVCWSGKGISFLPPGVEVIVLSEKQYGIEVEEYPDIETVTGEKPLHRIIGYNSTMAGGRPFSAFENTLIFRTNIKFKDDTLPKGSVIVLYEKGWLIGEMTVSSYVYIEKPPRTEVEKNLYRLVTYPVTIDEDPVVFDTWLKGHIIYSDFKVYNPPVNFEILERKMSRGGSLNLDFDELQLIRGRKKVSPSGKKRR